MALCFSLKCLTLKEVIVLISLKIKGVSSEFKRLREELRKEEKRKLQKVCEQAIAELRDKTPVDTGFAKSQWRLVKTKSKTPEFEIHNETPYIDFLNLGSSKQAPKYFVERTMLKYGKPVGAITKYSS